MFQLTGTSPVSFADVPTSWTNGQPDISKLTTVKASISFTAQNENEASADAFFGLKLNVVVNATQQKIQSPDPTLINEGTGG